MSEDRGLKNPNGLSVALLVLGVLVIALLEVFLFVEPVGVQPDLTATAARATETLRQYPFGTEQIPPPVVNIDGIAILGGVMVLVVLAAVYREILIHKRETKKNKA